MAPKVVAPPKAKAEDTDSKKRSAGDAMEPLAKQSKRDESKEEKWHGLEKEEDASSDDRPTLKDCIVWDPMHCTLNALPAAKGKVLMSLSEAGMQFLVAGARANVGIKSGRYMFEARVVEGLNPVDVVGNRGRGSLPRQLLRVGFSLVDSCLVMGESEECIYFDAEGAFTAGRHKISVCKGIGRDQTIAVLLNLDDKSPNYQTVSLFRNGERFCEPQPLPDALKGKTLYPHISYRNVSVQINFGPNPLVPLRFTCACLSTAADSDVEVAKTSEPKDGKYSVLFPVALPDEGTFDWLDTFIDQNPQYVELSDRKIIDLAIMSGLFKPNSAPAAMDDISVRRVLQVVAPLVPRNYVFMDVKENLLKADRKANLQRFCNPMYKKVAHVVVGEPNAEYKKRVHSRILKEKKETVEAAWKEKKQNKENKSEEKETKKGDGEAGEKKDAGKDDDAPPEVELTEEEKKIWFSPPVANDLTSTVLSQTFPTFALPEDTEGFDEINYEWQPASKATEYLRNWVLEKKVTSKIEDMKPSEWFKTMYENFTKTSKDWQEKQKAFTKKKEADKKPKEDDAAEKKDENVDVLAVENILDIGNGEPLFSHFTFEDWALLNLRYELFLLFHTYKRDVDDVERIGIHETNLEFYYSTFYHKQLNPKFYGKEDIKEVVDLVTDTVSFDKERHVLKSELEHDVDSLEIFVKLTEEGRLERQRRRDAGDETVRLKFNPMLGQVTKQVVVPAKGSAKPPSPVGVKLGAEPASAWGVAPRPKHRGGNSKWGSSW